MSYAAMQVTQVTQQGKVQNKAKGCHIRDTWQAKHNMKYSMLYYCLIKYSTDSHIYNRNPAMKSGLHNSQYYI